MTVEQRASNFYEAITAYGGNADELTLKPLVVGAKMLDILAPINREHIDQAIIVRLTELAQQLPGNVAANEPDKEPFVIKKDVTPKDIADMVRKALASEGGEQ